MFPPQARRMANMTYSVMHESCNNIMIGKVYWKSLVLPAVLTGASVLCWTRSELEMLQRIENEVWRVMQGTDGYAPVSILQGEVGATGVVARDIKIKLGYQKYLIDCENEMLHEIYEDVRQSQVWKKYSYLHD